MNESWNVSVDNSSRTKANWSVKNCSLRKQSTNWQSTAARARNSKRWRKWRPATLATNPGHTAFMFFPRSWHVVMGTAVTRILRCVARDHYFSVRNGRLMTRHEQSLKAHEHTSNSSRLMSISQNSWAIAEKPWANSSWKLLMRISKSSWALMRTHEDSWVPHEDSWVPHEVLMRKKFLATFFCKGRHRASYLTWSLEDVPVGIGLLGK